MRCAPVVLALLVAIGLTGCSTTTSAPSTTPTTSAAASSAAAPTTAALTADGAFEQPILCRAVVDYETTQAAIATGKLTTVRKVAGLAATDRAAGLASDRAHAWAAEVQPLLEPYLAAGDAQVRYFRAVAEARSVDVATALVWPDGTSVSTPVYAAIGISGNLTCPKP